MTKGDLWFLVAVLGLVQACNVPCYEGCTSMSPGADCLGTCGCTQADIDALPPPPPQPQPLTPECAQQTGDPKDCVAGGKGPGSKGKDKDDRDDHAGKGNGPCGPLPCPAPLYNPEPAPTQPIAPEAVPISALSESTACLQKCEDVCPQGGVCKTACAVHFCGVEQETHTWPVVFLVGAVLVLLGFWAGLHVNWRKSIFGAKQRPLLGEPLDL